MGSSLAHQYDYIYWSVQAQLQCRLQYRWAWGPRFGISDLHVLWLIRPWTQRGNLPYELFSRSLFDIHRLFDMCVECSHEGRAQIILNNLFCTESMYSHHMIVIAEKDASWWFGAGCCHDQNMVVRFYEIMIVLLMHFWCTFDALSKLHLKLHY